MLRPFYGMGNKNKAEALYLLKGHQPFIRTVERPEDYQDDRESPKSYLVYFEKRFGRCGGNVTMEEAIAFLGPIPNLPDWMQEEDLEIAKIREVYAEIAPLRGLYGSVMLEIACDPFTPPIDVKTLVVIHSFCVKKNLLAASDDSRPSARISVSKLAWRVGVSKQHLLPVLERLEERGAIDISRRNRSASTYYINKIPILTLGNPKRIIH